MNVAYHSSDGFSPVLGTSIASLLENNKNMDNIHIFVLEENISVKNKKKLTKLVDRYQRIISFIPMPDINKTQNLGLKKVREDWFFNSYCRLFLDVILPDEIGKVLYLDSDVLVTGDLTKLWNLDLCGYCAASVRDCFSKKYFSLLGLKDDSTYCNSGMILQNLDLWRERKVGDRVRKYVKDNGGYVFFMEQTVYNAVLQKDMLILPPQYNTYTIMQCLTYKEILRLRNPKNYYSEQEIRNAVENPKIIHMTSFFLIKNRAWYKDTNHPAKQDYEKYKKLTPWKDEPGFSDARSSQKKFLQFFMSFLPRVVVISVAGFVYNSLRVCNIKRSMHRYKTKFK